MKIKKLFILLAEICALSFAPVFLIKILLNNGNCIQIMEPIWWIRIPEAGIALFTIIVLFPKLINDSCELFVKGGIKQ